MIGSNGLLRAIQAMLPDAAIAIVNESPWYSLTFAGVQMGMKARLQGDGHEAVAEEFIKALPEHEFDLRGLLVADIAVTGTIVSKAGTLLLIDALLLED